MPFADFCTKKQIIQLVKWSYESICKNKVLASIFNQHAKNCDLHLSTKLDLWAFKLCGSARFCGELMLKHIALPKLNFKLFEHWLTLFRQTTDALAKRITKWFWHGYQMNPDALKLVGVA